MKGSCKAQGSVVISELRNDDPERFELHNGTSSQVDLSGWTLKWTADNGSDSFEIPSGTAVEPGEFVAFEEGSSGGSNVIALETTVRWNSGIALALLNKSGMGVDFVRTGGISASPPSGTSWSGGNADNPEDSGNESLARNVYESDTDAAKDWSIRESFTPASYCDSGEQTCGGTCVSEASASNCGACGRVCAGSDACNSDVCAQEATARIAGGGSNGRVEIWMDGEWGVVCDDYFDDEEADVVCRQLGYSSGTVDYGVEDTPAEEYDVSGCTSSDTHLSECNVRQGSCFSYEQVGVDCEP